MGNSELFFTICCMLVFIVSLITIALFLFYFLFDSNHLEKKTKTINNLNKKNNKENFSDDISKLLIAFLFFLLILIFIFGLNLLESYNTISS